MDAAEDELGHQRRVEQPDEDHAEDRAGHDGVPHDAGDTDACHVQARAAQIDQGIELADRLGMEDLQAARRQFE